MAETSSPAFNTQVLHDFFDASPIGIAVENVERKFLFVNPALCAMLGVAKKEICGKSSTQFSPPEDVQNDQLLFQKLRIGALGHYQIEKRYFRRDGSLIWGRVSFSLLNIHSSPLVLAMLEDITQKRITERKMAEETLHELNRALEEQTAFLQSREQLLKIFVKNVPAGVAMLDSDMRYLQVSDRWCTDYSVESSRILGHSHYEIFPDLPQRWKEIHRLALTGQTLRADEDRWDREGGATWVRWEIRPWNTPSGAVGGILIFAEDITKRKEMEEALLASSRKLIESQEQERARIGRELHDDINQRLAMLAMSLEQLQENPSGLRRRVQDLRKDLIELSMDVQGLAHELHAAKLEYLGVVAGIKSWCKQFSKRQRIEIAFNSDVPNPLPYEIGLCLLRVLQEGLHNAVKYSGVKQIAVQLAQYPREVHLMISDSGTGFDVELAKQGKGLGLTSMRERVLLVHGTITIESRPMAGTTIHVRIPVASQDSAQKAVG